MDRHWNTTVTRLQVIWSVKSNDPTATTWSISPARKRRSNPVQWHHQDYRKKKFDDASQWLLERLDINSGKWRRSEEKISMLRESKLFQSIVVPSSNFRIFRRYCYWSCIARQCTFTERIYRVHLPRREREWIELHYKKCINSRRKKPQEKKTSGILHNPMEDVHGMGEAPCDLTKPIIAPYKNTWKRLSKNSMLVYVEARSRERLAILANTVTCSRSLQHTTCSLHWESDLCENSGWALPKGSLTSKIATCRTKIELAMRSTRSTKPRRKIILGTIERFEEVRGNLWQHCGLQNIWSTSFCSRAAGHNTREQGQEVHREVREPQT